MALTGPNRVQRSVLPRGGDVDGGNELVDLWRARIDPTRTSIKGFIECYKVPSKVVGTVENGQILTTAAVPFKELEFQRVGREIIEDQWKQGTGGKTLGAKPRQQGETTGKLLLAWERFVRAGGGTGNYFSYDDPHSMEAFSLLLFLRRQTPAWVFEHLMHETKKDDVYQPGGGVWTKKSARQVELTFPGDIPKHLLQCATAGGKSAGSGSAPRWVFLDEITLYDAKTKADITGMTAAWQDAPGNIMAMWGTGRGLDRYARMFLAHHGRVSVDGYVAYFRSWLGHKLRSVPFSSDEARAAFQATVGALKEFGIGEEGALLMAGATPEELNWRRIKLSDPTFNLDLKLFAREFPLTPADSFASESGTVFQIELLKTHDAAARARELAARVGDFVERDGGVVEFQKNRAGSWTLYEEPVPESYYCWGADPASGKARQAGSRVEADFACAAIGEVYSGRVVARFRAHLEGRDFGYEIVKASVFFATRDARGALVTPARGRGGVVEELARGYHEVNGEWGQATTYRMERKLEELGYLKEECILFQHHPILADGKRPEPSLGWYTSRDSRGRLIDETKTFIAEIGEYKPERGTPYDVAFLAEAYCFERDEKNRVEASTGHDDDVFARMLMWTARDVLISDGYVLSKPKSKDSDRYDPAKDFVKLCREGPKKRSGSPLGGAF